MTDNLSQLPALAPESLSGQPNSLGHTHGNGLADEPISGPAAPDSNPDNSFAVLVSGELNLDDSGSATELTGPLFGPVTPESAAPDVQGDERQMNELEFIMRRGRTGHMRGPHDLYPESAGLATNKPTNAAAVPTLTGQTGLADAPVAGPQPTTGGQQLGQTTPPGLLLDQQTITDLLNVNRFGSGIVDVSNSPVNQIAQTPVSFGPFNHASSPLPVTTTVVTQIGSPASNSIHAQLNGLAGLQTGGRHQSTESTAETAPFRGAAASLTDQPEFVDSTRTGLFSGNAVTTNSSRLASTIATAMASSGETVFEKSARGKAAASGTAAISSGLPVQSGGVDQPSGAERAPLTTLSGAGGRESLPLAGQISDQVKVMIQSDQREARLLLHPRELGSVNIRISMQSEQASVAIEASNPELLKELSNTIPRLRQLFVDEGLGLNNLALDMGQFSDSQDQLQDQQQTGQLLADQNRAGTSETEDPTTSLASAPYPQPADDRSLDLFA